MFKANKIQTVTKYNGWLLSEQQQNIINKFIKENQDSVITGYSNDDNYLYVQEGLEVVCKDWCDYSQDETQLTRLEFKELKNILLEADALGIEIIYF
jgi:hypothetical protein